MKTNWYLNGKKITIKRAKEIVGADRYSSMVKEAKEVFFDDPLTEISWYTGAGYLVIKFN